MYQIEDFNYFSPFASVPHCGFVESDPPTKEPCRYCKGTGKMTLFTSVVPCDQCGKADEANRLLRP